MNFQLIEDMLRYHKKGFDAPKTLVSRKRRSMKTYFFWGGGARKTALGQYYPKRTISAGVTVGSLQGACQKAEGAEVVGQGSNVLFTSSHLDMRRSVFDHLHDGLAKYAGDEEKLQPL